MENFYFLFMTIIFDQIFIEKYENLTLFSLKPSADIARRLDANG